MKTILHLSDLHLKEDKDYSIKLNELTKVIRNNYTEIDVLVVSGDMKNWDDNFDSAVNLINTIVDDLNVKDVIVTPGNHDVMVESSSLLEYDISSGSCNIFNEEIPCDNLEKQYHDFYSACKEIKNCKIQKSIQTVSVGNINFLVASSVCGFGNNNKVYCCNCKALHNYIQKRSYTFLDKNKINIFVTHINDEKMCDSALFEYENKNAVMREIDSLFSFKLFGHIHVPITNTVNSIIKMSVGSNSFYDEKIRYNVYTINEEEKKYSIDSLLYSNSKWSLDQNTDYQNQPISPSKGFIAETIGTESIVEIYSASKSYLKSKIFDKDIETSIRTLTRQENSIKINNSVLFDEIKVTDFFKCITKLKLNSNSTKVEIENNIFDQLFKITSQCDNHNDVPFTIKGNIGTGKTTFLNLFYFYLLSKLRDNFDYIPLYIDVPNVLLETELSSYIEVIKELEKYKKKFYIILDGLDEKCVCGEDCMELENLKKSLSNAIYILGINSHQNTIRDKDVDFVLNNRKAKYLLYFNWKSKIPNYISSYINNDVFFSFKKFIKQYLEMIGVTYDDFLIKNVKNTINKYKINYLDFHVLYYIVKVLLDEKTEYTLVQLLNKSLFDYNQGKKHSDLPIAAYTYAYTNEYIRSYKISKVSFRTEDLKSQIMVDYLVAKHLADLINNNKLEKKEFNNYYNKSVNYFLYEFLHDGTIQVDLFLDNLEKTYPHLTLKAKVQFLFLLRNLGDNAYSFISNEELIVKPENKMTIDELVFNRTLLLSKLRKADGTIDIKRQYEYIYRLIKKSELARINRFFNLFYYGDLGKINSNTISKETEHIFLNKKSIDNNLFVIFKQRENCRLEDNEIIINMTREFQERVDVNVFTIVNILQNCILYYDHLENTGIKNSLIENLVFMTSFLSKYTLNYYRNTTEEKMIFAYYKMMLNDFYSFLEIAFRSNNRYKEKHQHRVMNITVGSVSKPIYNYTPLSLYDIFDTSKILSKDWEDFDSFKYDNIKFESVSDNTVSLLMLAFVFLDKGVTKSTKEGVLRLIFLNNLAEGLYRNESCNDLDSNETIKQIILFFTLLGTYNKKVNYTDSFKVAYAYFEDDKIEAVKIYNEIRTIQHYLKMKNYENNGISFCDDFKEKITNDLSQVKTPQGIEIKNKLIDREAKEP